MLSLFSAFEKKEDGESRLFQKEKPIQRFQFVKISNEFQKARHLHLQSFL
jgi:hypothetical protein